MLHSLTSTSWFISWNSVQNVLDVDVLNRFSLVVAGLFVSLAVLVFCLMYKAKFIWDMLILVEFESVL